MSFYVDNLCNSGFAWFSHWNKAEHLCLYCNHHCDQGKPEPLWLMCQSPCFSLFWVSSVSALKPPPGLLAYLAKRKVEMKHIPGSVWGPDHSVPPLLPARPGIQGWAPRPSCRGFPLSSPSISLCIAPAHEGKPGQQQPGTAYILAACSPIFPLWQRVLQHLN